MYNFTANLNLIGVNPFVFVPHEILQPILNHARNQKGKIPIRGTINQLPYQQTLVKYSGDWRLYINTSMLKNSPKRIGETLEITIEVDPTDRRLKLHPQLMERCRQTHQPRQFLKAYALRCNTRSCAT